MSAMKTMLRLFSMSAITCAGIAQAPQPAVPIKMPPVIHLNVVVAQKSGIPVPGLPQSAFTVLDNGKPQPIQSFHAVNDEADAVNVMIVIDSVNIPYVQLAYERNQINEFLKSNDGKLAHPTSIAVFTDTSLEATSFTTSGTQLSQTLGSKEIGLRDIRRSAGFWGDAEQLEMSLKALQTVLTRAQSQPGRKVVLWVSPGWPYLSGPRVQLTSNQENELFRDVVYTTDLIRNSNTTLYAVDPLGASESVGRTFYYEEFLSPLRKPSDALPGYLSLQALAIQSGGEALSGSNDVKALLQHCMDQTKAFYEITYPLPPSDTRDQFHAIQVKVAEGGVKVHTTVGYYGNP